MKGFDGITYTWAITTIAKKSGCTTEYHNTPTAYIKFILQ